MKIQGSESIYIYNRAKRDVNGACSYDLMRAFDTLCIYVKVEVSL